MFRNYFKTAFRSLRANKVYSFITVAGLGVGIAVCLVIFLFISYEQSFDTFHSKSARIYRVLIKGAPTPDKETRYGAGVPFPVPWAIKHDLPDWTTSAAFMLDDIQLMPLDKAGNPEKKFKEKTGVLLVQPAFFSIFDFHLVAGDPATVLTDRMSVVMTQSTAERFFGDWRQAVGRTIKFQDHDVFKVTGVMADVPGNSDFNKVHLLFNYAIVNTEKSTDWWSVDAEHEVYVLLPEHVSLATADRQLDALSKKYQTPDDKNTQVLEPLAAVHFSVKQENFSGRTISAERIRTLWLIAGFILLIACVNFINIATAQAVNRAKEVGVRKVMGSNRGQLRLQFLLEAFLLVVVSVVLAVLLTALCMGPISKNLDMPVSLHLFEQGPVLLFLGVTTVVVTLLAGIYPALVLSGFNPITALRAKLAARSSSGITLRRGLVVLQFVIAQALIIGTLLVLRQLNYFTHQSIGFDKQALIAVPFPGDSVSISKLNFLRDRIMAVKGVEQVSFNNAVPAALSSDNWWTDFSFDHSKKDAGIAAIRKWVDANYISTYGMKLVAGRNITTTDSVREFLINETLARKLGYSDPQKILNREINLWNGWAVGAIVGVVRDFHPTSMKDSLSGVFMLNFKRGFSNASIKLDGRDLIGSVAALEKIWSATYPDYVFEYQFLDEKIASFYKDEARLSLFYQVFALIAIFLSCLGLYGLASFMAAQRLKEVGIRKVLGATAANIVYLFSREFVVLISIAFVISAPIAWYFVHAWAQQYVFRIPISGWIFVGGGGIALLIALMTVSFQAIRAANSNPIISLKSE
jgi:putative ABC transport system permease protein